MNLLANNHSDLYGDDEMPEQVSPKQVDVPKLPWSARAKELEPLHGPYADFGAWEEWMTKQMDLRMEWWEGVDVSDRPFLYQAFLQLAAWLAEVKREDA